MRETSSVTQTLVRHFFRRFFDNDTLQLEGDTLTTVVRALAIVAVPGLLIAFFLQNEYPRRSTWGSIEDEYFFVLFSFTVMGAVAIFEWEMLFPDRLDFLILSPLSLQPYQLLGAKAAALAGFLGLFLAGANLLGTLTYAAIVNRDFFRQLYAQTTAVLLAGIFASLLFVALGGVLLCVLPAAQFRVISPLVQMLSVAGLALFLLHYARFASGMEAILTPPPGASLGAACWLPPIWFLALYEHLLHGQAAPAFAAQLAPWAWRAVALAGAVVLATYPIAWARMRRTAIEGRGAEQRRPSRWLPRLVHTCVRRPGERAAFHYIGQTIARNNHYQVYLAMYGGSGLALAISCATTFRTQAGRSVATVSEFGMHAVMPLLLFWVIAGLRTAFAFPLNLSAGWIFRITGVDLRECAAAARTWVLSAALALMLGILAALRLAGWNSRHLLVQAVCGTCLCVLLTDSLFLFQEGVPFNRPRMPGKTNLPLLLTLYVGALPPCIFGVIHLDLKLEASPVRLLWVALATLALHVGLRALRRAVEPIEEEVEGYEGEFQLLNLSAR